MQLQTNMVFVVWLFATCNPPSKKYKKFKDACKRVFFLQNHIKTHTNTCTLVKKATDSMAVLSYFKHVWLTNAASYFQNICKSAYVRI